MMHLPVHLAEEARLGGPICFRWMYQVERYLRTLKGFVRNKAHPEGSIAEGYISEECLTFCSRFFEDISTKLNRPERHESAAASEPPSGLSIFGRFVGLSIFGRFDYRLEGLTTEGKDVLLRVFLILKCTG